MVEEFTLEKDGFCGTYFKGEKHLEKAIIFMSGAGISQKLTESSASFLIKQGYSVLVLGFYNWKGMPKEMYGIPVEYVELAAKWLLSFQEQKIEKIAIMGTSTGAGYALLSASLCPQISCVIAISPFDYVMEGAGKNFSRKYKSTYTYRKRDICFTPNIALDKGAHALIMEAKRDKRYGLRRAMRYVYDINPPIDESRILIENMKADVLLLAAKADDFWPSDEAVSRMEKILSESNYPYRVKIIVYDKASHLLGNISGMSWILKRLIRLIITAEHKFPVECENARKDSVQQILSFLNEW